MAFTGGEVCSLLSFWRGVVGSTTQLLSMRQPFVCSSRLVRLILSLRYWEHRPGSPEIAANCCNDNRSFGPDRSDLVLVMWFPGAAFDVPLKHGASMPCTLPSGGKRAQGLTHLWSPGGSSAHCFLSSRHARPQYVPAFSYAVGHFIILLCFRSPMFRPHHVLGLHHGGSIIFITRHGSEVCGNIYSHSQSTLFCPLCVYTCM